MKRNIKRFKESKEKNLDNHIVPPDLLESYYRSDDFEKLFLESEKKLKEFSPAELMVVKNEGDKILELEKNLKKLAEKIIGSIEK